MGASMTRQDILTMCRDNMGEVFGTPGQRFPEGWQKIISTAADDVAQETRCYYAAFSNPIKAYQGAYCCPELLEAEAIHVFTSDGVRHTLDPATIAAMDDWSSDWRNAVAATQPNTAVVAGLNNIVLYPVPNYASAVASYTDLVLVNGQGGFQLSSVARPFVNAAAPAGDVGLWINITSGTGYSLGWYQISSVSGGIATVLQSAGTAGSTAGVASLTSGGLWMEGPAVPGATWENLTDNCPLPDRAHMAVVYKACILRCLRLPSKENAIRRDWLSVEMTKSLGSLEKETHRFTQASRMPALISSPGFGSGDQYGNPLEM